MHAVMAFCADHLEWAVRNERGICDGKLDLDRFDPDQRFDPILRLRTMYFVVNFVWEMHGTSAVDGFLNDPHMPSLLVSHRLNHCSRLPRNNTTIRTMQGLSRGVAKL